MNLAHLGKPEVTEERLIYCDLSSYTLVFITSWRMDHKQPDFLNSQNLATQEFIYNFLVANVRSVILSIKFEFVSFEMGDVLPYGWIPFPGQWNGTIMGHEFTMVGTFKIKRAFVLKSGKHITNSLPALEWKEKEFWYEGTPGGASWKYLGETDKGDLYQTNPSSPTWGGFSQGKTKPDQHNWIRNPGCDVNSTLHAKLLSLKQINNVHMPKMEILRMEQSKSYQATEVLKNTRGHRDEALLKQWWMAAEKMIGQKLPCIALDRPGMALSGGSGASGGGFKSLTTSPTRRRILQFDLGMVGCARRFSATQVLETIDGNPSISKFIIPGRDDNWCKNLPAKHLAYWRSILNSSDVEDQSTEYETDNVVGHVKWAR